MVSARSRARPWVALAVGGALIAACVGLALDHVWLRLDELPWLWRDLSNRTAWEPGALATDADVAALEDGMAVAFELAPTLFPLGLDGIDVALYDHDQLLVWTRRPVFGGTPHGTWRDFSRIATPVWARPTERSMRTCRESEGFANWSRVRAVTRSERFFMCAPQSTFMALQRGRGIYDTKESYLATVVHEVAHQYLALHPAAHPAAKLSASLATMPAGVDRQDVLGEAFATWAELRASQARFPEHVERLRGEFRASCERNAEDVHCLGLRGALEVFDAEALR
jgi:hypothetical protein